MAFARFPSNRQMDRSPGMLRPSTAAQYIQRAPALACLPQADPGGPAGFGPSERRIVNWAVRFLIRC